MKVDVSASTQAVLIRKRKFNSFNVEASGNMASWVVVPPDHVVSVSSLFRLISVFMKMDWSVPDGQK